VSELLVLGASHKTAPIALRERVALSDGRAGAFLQELVADAAVREAAAISTCNRTEIYLVASDPVEAETAALGMLARHAGIRPTELVEVIYSHRNCDAARHLFRVAAGLESMIVGEGEVQGQVRRAHELSREHGTTGPLLHRVFAEALATGKRVRSETAISERRLSLSSVAVELARETLGELERRHVLVLGAGETSELTAQALAERGVRTIFVANRRRDRAVSLARRFGGASVSFDALPVELERADIVVASTGSPHTIVGREELDLVMAARAGRPLLLIDLAVPRDIDSDCAELDGVRLYDIDDLQAVVARNRSVRAAEALRAEAIVEDEIQRFARWLGSLDVLPTVAALRDHGAAVAEGVLAEHAHRWETASPADLRRVERIARTVVNRLLHEPTLRLKRASGEERGHARAQLLRELFGLDDGAAQEPAGAEVHELPRRSA
jgi:glutamyl-tRNA reductase